MPYARRKEAVQAWNGLVRLARRILGNHGLRSQPGIDELDLRDSGVRAREIAAMVDRDMSKLLCRDLWRQGPKTRS